MAYTQKVKRMRDYIGKALSRASKESERIIEFQHKRSLESNANAKYTLTNESFLRLQEMYRYQKSIMIHFQELESVHVCFAGTESSVVIRWETGAETVIELSQWGALAAVYTYRSLDSSYQEHISRYLAELGLVQLSDSEIDELTTNGFYHHLF